MKALLIGYKSCSTCKKTEKFLEDRKIDYKFQDVKEEKPEKDQIKGMTEDEKLDLLASDGMLLKRPILVYGDDVVVGRLNIEKYFEK